VLRADDQSGVVKHSAVNLDLGGEASQGICVTLDLKSVDKAINDRDIDTTHAVA
jgi:hypothetical protein